MKPGSDAVIQRRARPRPWDRTLSPAASWSSARCTVRWLASKREREGGARPRFTVGEKGDHRRMLPFDRTRQHHELTCATRHQPKPKLRRAHARQRRSSVRSLPISTRKRARCDSSACFARKARLTSGSLDRWPGQTSPTDRASTNNTGRRVSETTVRRLAQHGGMRPRQGRGIPGRLDLVEEEESLLATRHQPSRGRVQYKGCAFHLRDQGGIPAWRAGTRPGRGPRGPLVQRRRVTCPRRPVRRRPLRRRERRRIEPGERVLGLVEPPDQQNSADFEMPRMGGVHPVAMRFEGRPRRVERLRRPGQVARNERDLGLGDDTSRPGHGSSDRRRGPHRRRAFARTKSPSCAIAIPRRASAGARPAGRPASGRRGGPGRERPRRSRDQRVHRNPVTLVTPPVRCPAQPGPSLTRDDQPGTP